MQNLFAYGTLMCRDIMEEVAGCRPTQAEGVLEGFSRRRVRGAEYPGICSEEGRHVHGVVYYDVPQSAWKRLDRFEGAMYRRTPVKVRLGGRVVDAEAYVVRPEYIGELEAVEWDFGQFLDGGKARFQRSFRGYSSL